MWCLAASDNPMPKKWLPTRAACLAFCALSSGSIDADVTPPDGHLYIPGPRPSLYCAWSMRQPPTFGGARSFGRSPLSLPKRFTWNALSLAMTLDSLAGVSSTRRHALPSISMVTHSVECGGARLLSMLWSRENICDRPGGL